MRALLALPLLMVFAACGDDGSGSADANDAGSGDTGAVDASTVDASITDGSAAVDVGVIADSGSPSDAASDSGVPPADGGARSTVITQGAGGMLVFGDVTVTVPAGAVSEDTEITVQLFDAASLPGLPDDLIAVGPAIGLLPHGQIFSKPVVITMPHTSTAAAHSLSVQRLDDESDSTWEWQTGVSFALSEVTVRTLGFSVLWPVEDLTPEGVAYGSAMQSCGGLVEQCRSESCCTTIGVPGGTFPMGTMALGADHQPVHAVYVSDFRLDKYEVTVERFRTFLNAYDGSPPPADAGAHPLVPGSGWQSAWDSQLPGDQDALIESVRAAFDGTCAVSPFQEAGNNPALERRPIPCISWYLAFMFCAWDGGRLPTEAEWELAAAGGVESRTFPWGEEGPEEGGTLRAAYRSVYDGTIFELTLSDLPEAGSIPAGDGRWGHADLGGSVSEWMLDWYADDWYANEGLTCADCANVSRTTGNTPRRVSRGGAYGSNEDFLRSAGRSSVDPNLPFDGPFGIRCARD